jgi:hypothetical protein
MKRNTWASTLQTTAILLVLGLAIFLAVYGIVPSRVLPDSAPATEFSAQRAMRHIEVIATEPRPAGTEGNVRAREYIVEQLTLMGL